MGIDGSNPREFLGGLDRTPDNLTWAADGTGLWFSADHEGRGDVYFAPLAGTPRALTKGDHYLTLSGVSRTGTAVGVRATPTDPGNVVSIDTKTGQIRQLTDLNADMLAGKELGRTEEIWYRSVDDYKIQGWIIKPPGFDPSTKYAHAGDSRRSPRHVFDRDGVHVVRMAAVRRPGIRRPLH
jgi:dipeptidyl aminopeptidase/acylaminoacyl peptidase